MSLAYISDKERTMSVAYIIVSKLTNVGLLKSRGVIHPVSSDSDYCPLALTPLNYDELLLGRGAREHDLRVIAQYVVYLRGCHVAQV